MKKVVKAVLSKNHVYVCYEENGRELQVECGCVNAIKVFSNKRSAILYIYERAVKGVESEFEIDNEYGEVTLESLEKQMSDEGYVSIIMGNSYQGRFNEMYEIIAKKMECEK